MGAKFLHIGVVLQGRVKIQQNVIRKKYPNMSGTVWLTLSVSSWSSLYLFILTKELLLTQIQFKYTLSK